MTEVLTTLYNLMGLIFVLGTIISMGLGLTMAQIMQPLRNVRFVIMALLANFVVVPIAAFILIRLFGFDESIAVGLLLVALAAGARRLGARIVRRCRAMNITQQASGEWVV